ncbi:MAG: kelch repeat-containing protein [Actinomycetota bacterium]
MIDQLGFVEQLRQQLEGASERLSHRRRRRRNVALAVAGLVVIFGGLLAGLRRAEDTKETEAVAAIEDGTSLDQRSDQAVWSEAATVIGGEALPGVFWTGSEVIVLRTENNGNDVIGERWDPAANQASRIAASGLIWRANSAMTWTGEEVLVVGGSNGPGIEQIGAAYNPTSDTWRTLADPPGQVDAWENSIGGEAVWTGDEMILWRSGLAYNPETDSWRTIADPPLSPRARPAVVWTGSHLLVWGGCHTDGANCDETNTGLLRDGALYDPVSDLWTLIPMSPLTPAVHMVAGWTETTAIIVVTDPGNDTGELAATFDPDTLEWTTIQPPPLSARRFAAAAWTGDQFIVWGGGDGRSDSGTADGAAFDPLTGQWSVLPEGPGPGRSLHSMIPAGDRLYISATRTVWPPLQLRLGQRDRSTSQAAPTTSAQAPPDACIPAPSLPPNSGLIGLPISEVWPQGFKSGFDTGEYAFVEIEDPTFEGTWYAVGTVVSDLGDRPLGIGVWLSPDPIVAFAGPGEPGDPTEQPADWHLYSFNDLALQSSIWQRFPAGELEIDPVDAVQRCLGDTPAPLPFITGLLLDEGRWILSDDPNHGLCLVESDTDYGCDDIGPVVTADDPPETMRIAATLNPQHGIAEYNAGDLAYGYLPDGTSIVELLLPDGATIETNVVIDPDSRLWAAPIEPGNSPIGVRYLDTDGQTISEITQTDQQP